MAECEFEDSTGRLWSADEFALQYGHRLSEVDFASWMQNEFRVHSYERMQELWALRDRSISRNTSGTFPEGADINDYLGNP